MHMLTRDHRVVWSLILVAALACCIYTHWPMVMGQ
jgi:hypothetical protein